MDKQLQEKFAGIMAMIDGAKTEGEAQAAAAAFQRMLLKHNISEHEAQKLGGVGIDDIKKVFVRVGAPRTKGVLWKTNLLFTLARYNQCRAYKVGTTGGDMIIIGTERNITAVEILFSSLVETFRTMAQTEYQKFADTWDPELAFIYGDPAQPPKKSPWIYSFLLGVSPGLAARLRIEQEKMKGDLQGANALLVLTEEELSRAEENLVGKVKQTTGRTEPGSHEAYARGYTAGYSHGTNQIDDSTAGQLKG